MMISAAPRCGRAQVLAIILMVLWPIVVPLGYMALLLYCRDAILQRRSDGLADESNFLCAAAPHGSRLRRAGRARCTCCT